MTYQTAFLKTYYPHEFMCAVMISESGNQDDMIKCIAECKRMGIQVLPPDINSSQEEFTVTEEDEIRFGLAPIKNMGNSVDEIINERQRGGPFKSIRDFCERVDLGIINRGKIESLVKAGAMDRFGHSRATLLKSIQDIWSYREETKRYNKKLETYEKKIEAQKQRLADIENGVLSPKGKPLKPLKDPTKPEKPEWPELLEVDEMPEHELLKYEHELLGFYVSSHPLEKYQGTLHTRDLNTLEEVKLFDDKTDVSVAVVVASKKPFTTKNKKQMCFLKLEDMTGQIEAVLFPKQYNIYKNLLEEIVPLKIEGRVEIKETDDGKIAKMAAFSLELLDEDAGKTYSKDITLQVPARKAKEMAKLLSNCRGEAHKARVVLELQDGTKIIAKERLGIGNFTSMLQREALRMRHE
jgi:DNA polymerase-3 subunit alpha